MDEQRRRRLALRPLLRRRRLQREPARLEGARRVEQLLRAQPHEREAVRVAPRAQVHHHVGELLRVLGHRQLRHRVELVQNARLVGASARLPPRAHVGGLLVAAVGAAPLPRHEVALPVDELDGARAVGVRLDDHLDEDLVVGAALVLGVGGGERRRDLVAHLLDGLAQPVEGGLQLLETAEVGAEHDGRLQLVRNLGLLLDAPLEPPRHQLLGQVAVAAALAAEGAHQPRRDLLSLLDAQLQQHLAAPLRGEAVLVGEHALVLVEQPLHRRAHDRRLLQLLDALAHAVQVPPPQARQLAAQQAVKRHGQRVDEVVVLALRAEHARRERERERRTVMCVGGTKGRGSHDVFCGETFCILAVFCGAAQLGKLR